jgi:UDP-N-acetylmuramate--alanine ligase
VAYLQPHTFSRTEALYHEWSGACADADLLLVGDVYAAREQGDASAVAHALAARIAASGVDARHVGSVADATTALIALARPGDVVLTLGAGDGDRVGLALIEHLRGRA